MPTYLRPDDKPVVHFDPLIEISPFTLFRLLKEDQAPMLVDARESPTGVTLEGALPLPGEAWEPDEAARVVLFDEDGREAEPIVRHLQGKGFTNVKMLFGGLELYVFSLDPQVVGETTFLKELRVGG